MDGERRSAPRTPRRLRVLLGGDVVFTADVTANGFCAETPKVAQPGTSMSGTIILGEREFEFTGIICWARSADARMGRMGVRFLDVPRELQEQLAATH